MGFLDRLLRKAVSDAVEEGVKNAVEPKVEEAAGKWADAAADHINQQTQAMNDAASAAPAPQAQAQSANTQQAASSLENAFAGWANAVQNFANEAAKNMKVCPSCGQATSADKKFCPNCGSKLPETTVAQNAVCPKCGTQNNVGAKFCAGCGEALPQIEKPVGQVIHSAPAVAPAASAYDGPKGPAGVSWGEFMPDEPNQYNFNGNYIEYFDMIFREDFSAYRVEKQRAYSGKACIYTLYGAAGKAIVIEVLSTRCDVKKLRNDCRKEGTPYLRFYHDYDGWWNTRSYVVNRVKSAIR